MNNGASFELHSKRLRLLWFYCSSPLKRPSTVMFGRIAYWRMPIDRHVCSFSTKTHVLGDIFPQKMEPVRHLMTDLIILWPTWSDQYQVRDCTNRYSFDVSYQVRAMFHVLFDIDIGFERCFPPKLMAKWLFCERSRGFVTDKTWRAVPRTVTTRR
jgi:hypothetical protein